MRHGALLLASALAVAACGERSPAPPAPVPAASAVQASGLATWLRGAEVQAETDAQRRELRRALADLATKPVGELRALRYAGPGGEPGQRDLVQVLRAHLLPGAGVPLDAERLLSDAAQPDARAALHDKMAEIDRGLTAASAPVR